MRLRKGSRSGTSWIIGSRNHRPSQSPRRFHSWDADLALFLGIDPALGDDVQAPRPGDVFAAAVPGDLHEMIAALAAGEVHTMDRDLSGVGPRHGLSSPVREFAVGQEKHGLRTQAQGLPD